MPSYMKQRTIEARMNRRKEAAEAWAKAREQGLMEEARTYAMASTKINKEIVESSKELLGHMGIAYMQAPSEGEAQAAYLNKNGLVDAAASQDYDLFLFGSKVVVRNLTITGRRKLPKKNVFINIEPERIYLKDLLERFELSQRGLILLGILIGTDFNEGVGKVGPKTALKIVKEHKSADAVARYVEQKYGVGFGVEINEVLDIFESPAVREIGKGEFDNMLSAAKPDHEKLLKFMCDEHGFSRERVEKFAEKMIEMRHRSGQKQLSA